MDMKTTGLSRASVYDQFICRFWITKKPLWCMMVTSTYGILITTLSRYFAVVYPIQYNRVRILHLELFSACVGVLCCPVCPSVCVLCMRVWTALDQRQTWDEIVRSSEIITAIEGSVIFLHCKNTRQTFSEIQKWVFLHWANKSFNAEPYKWKRYLHPHCPSSYEWKSAKLPHPALFVTTNSFRRK